MQAPGLITKGQHMNRFLLQSILSASIGFRFVRPVLAGLLPLTSALLPLGDCSAAHAAEPTSVQWNIMVVPGNQTAFSSQARELFGSHCASCHSKDGRAQTPVARQRHVQDLSECRLPDEQIVQQILHGTHDKTVDFKMPPFSEKLAPAEIDALVPLVKAFRPVFSENENLVAQNPRLAGIINFPNHQAAILEKVAFSGRYFVLNPNESHDGIQLAKILPDQGTVRLWVNGRNTMVTLKLDGGLVQPRNTSFREFLRHLLNSGGDRYSLALDRANTDLVLFLHAQLTGRTLLRSPRIPTSSFSLNATATTPALIVRTMQDALAEKGVAIVPDGDKFLLATLSAEISLTRPCSVKIKTLTGFDKYRERFPGGVFINLPNAELNQAASLYTALTGRVLCSAEGLPSNRLITLTTQSALSLEEGAYALETLFSWHGLQIVPVGGGFKVISVVGARP